MSVAWDDETHGVDISLAIALSIDMAGLGGGGM